MTDELDDLAQRGGPDTWVATLAHQKQVCHLLASRGDDMTVLSERDTLMHHLLTAADGVATENLRQMESGEFPSPSDERQKLIADVCTPEVMNQVRQFASEDVMFIAWLQILEDWAGLLEAARLIQAAETAMSESKIQYHVAPLVLRKLRLIQEHARSCETRIDHVYHQMVYAGNPHVRRGLIFYVRGLLTRCEHLSERLSTVAQSLNDMVFLEAAAIWGAQSDEVKGVLVDLMALDQEDGPEEEGGEKS